MSNTSPFPLYIGHKLVRAIKIKLVERIPGDLVRITPEDDGYHPFELGASFDDKHKPQRGGYFVLYEDGYASYSPAEPFENGYTKAEGPSVIDDGHRYRLTGPQVLQFIKKGRHSQIPEISLNGEMSLVTVFETVAEGTTTEEVLAVLIARTRSLNAAVPCRENALALTHMETALLWFESRTKARQTAGVEGTPNHH